MEWEEKIGGVRESRVGMKREKTRELREAKVESGRMRGKGD